MAMNMSYCMCENTLAALNQVHEEIDIDYLKQNDREMKAALQLVEGCLLFMEEHGDGIIAAAESVPQTERLKRLIADAKGSMEVLSP